MKRHYRDSSILVRAYTVIRLCLTLAVVLGWSASARAELPAWQCEGAPVFDHNNVIALDLADQSQAGDTVMSDFNSGQSGAGRCNCPSPGRYYSYFTAETDLPVQDGGWIKLNDYLDARVSIYVYGHGNLQVPFNKRRNAGLSSCPELFTTISNVATGNRGNITFRLRQGIIGEVTFSGRLATLYWQLNDSTGAIDRSFPFTHVNADVRLTALASCQFRAGDTFSIDLDKIDKAALTEGGMPRRGFTPKSIDLSLDCVNLGSSGTVNYMFQSVSGSEGDILLTDLRGLGIGLLDGDDNPVGLGIDNAIEVPVASDTTTFYLKPYPTKLPGKAVASGRYTAQAIVTVSLP